MTEHFSQAWDVAIVPYAPQYRADFARLTYEWYHEYHFSAEPIDRCLLANPQKHVLSPGGVIFLAQCCEHIVGCCGARKHAADTFELIKLGVSKYYRGRKIGQALVETTLAHVKSVGGQRVMLYTNTKLGNACRLYRKLGFIEKPMPDGAPYKKADRFMMKILEE
jgi:ribosomal protein S18 acetylase RimI-like enzyme